MSTQPYLSRLWAYVSHIWETRLSGSQIWMWILVAPAFLDPEGGYTMHACMECTLLMQEMS